MPNRTSQRRGQRHLLPAAGQLEGDLPGHEYAARQALGNVVPTDVVTVHPRQVEDHDIVHSVPTTSAAQNCAYRFRKVLLVLDHQHPHTGPHVRRRFRHDPVESMDPAVTRT